MRTFALISTLLAVASSCAFAQTCYNVPDGNIVCAGTANNTFRICNAGVASREVQQCASPLVCCGNSCVESSNQLCFPPYNPTCQGVSDYKTVCLDQQKFQYCLNNKLYPYSSPISCAPGTVCCPSTGQCNYASACNIFALPPPSQTTPSPSPTVPSPIPSSAPTSCAGTPDYQTACFSDTTYQYCLNNKPYPNSGPQPCAPGTVCCRSSGRCDYASNCKAVVPKGEEVVPQNSPVPAVPPTVSCAGVIDGDIVCSGPTTYNTCIGGTIASRDRPCATGSICCTTTNRCTFSWNCPAGGVIQPPAPAPSPLPPSPCAGIPDGFKICSTDGFSVFTCKSNYIFATETCLYGSKCCNDNKSCLAPGVPCGNPCSNRPDGFIACSGTKFDICKSGFSTGTIGCAAGTTW
ncbi:hypothetical protein HDU96_006231 [Phlyctochytrium bullatum]|nr:hypothetical protein HDU96_006231 [Phlyctochytrium bullatum]